MPRATRPCATPFGNAVEVGEVQPLVARDDRFVLGVQCAKGAEKLGSVAGKLVDDRAALLVFADDQPPAGADNLGQHLVERRSSSVGIACPLSFAFAAARLMRR